MRHVFLRAARVRKTISAILDDAVRAWLERSRADGGEDDAEQATRHAAAEGCLGAIAGGDPRRAEQARGAIRARLAKRHAR